MFKIKIIDVPAVIDYIKNVIWAQRNIRKHTSEATFFHSMLPVKKALLSLNYKVLENTDLKNTILFCLNIRRNTQNREGETYENK